MTEQTIRTVQGRVVSNKMDKTHHCCGRTQSEASYLWEIHQTYY